MVPAFLLVRFMVPPDAVAEAYEPALMAVARRDAMVVGLSPAPKLVEYGVPFTETVTVPASAIPTTVPVICTASMKAVLSPPAESCPTNRSACVPAVVVNAAVDIAL